MRASHFSLIVLGFVASSGSVGCSSDSNDVPVAVAVPATNTVDGDDDPDCDTLTPVLESESQPPEVEGVSDSATVFGLLFLTHSLPVRRGDEVKIVWRMTGEGELIVVSTSPTGRRGEITFGPDPHTSSSYNRPGDEWGTQFLFDEPGCWHIRLERTVGQGDVWLPVA